MIKLLKEIWELWIDYHEEMSRAKICVVAYPGIPFVFYIYDEHKEQQ